MPTDLTPPPEGDIPAAFKPVIEDNYVRRELMIPMRDGVQLFTILLIPTGVPKAPIILDRTPYSATKATRLTASTDARLVTYPFQGDLLAAGYITAVQDVRGKHKSEGVYVMNRPLRGPLNPTDTDHATDAYDTIEWLVANVPECNGKVGTIGISYDGFTALMSLIDPHPALKACVPINPMVDGWLGDDWFHNGAFRPGPTIPYVYRQTSTKGSDLSFPHTHYDEYDRWLSAGSAGAAGRAAGLDQLPFWQRMVAHPAYDSFWQDQAVDRLLAERPLEVPVLNVHSQWDAEDVHGIMDVHAALEAKDTAQALNRLVIGPWSHVSGCFVDGGDLGALKFGGPTGKWFRQTLVIPFLDRYLRDGDVDIARVTAFETGNNVWRTYDRWPQSGPVGSPHPRRPLYLADGGTLSFDAPTTTHEAAADAYVSDPAKPVTYLPRPIRPRGSPGDKWDASLVEDQRFAGDRPDVLSYSSAVLTEPLRLAGQPVAHVFASTTGSDADWVVKLIDVYPDQHPDDPALGGYQLAVSMDILRGRYRDDPAHPTPIPPGEIVHYTLRLPHISHVVLPGHRLMVQIQSTLFPLYDRNPQTYVDNIFNAEPGDYVAATHRVFRRADAASFIDLPIVPS